MVAAHIIVMVAVLLVVHVSLPKTVKVKIRLRELKVSCREFTHIYHKQNLIHVSLCININQLKSVVSTLTCCIACWILLFRGR